MAWSIHDHQATIFVLLLCNGIISMDIIESKIWWSIGTQKQPVILTVSTNDVYIIVSLRLFTDAVQIGLYSVDAFLKITS